MQDSVVNLKNDQYKTKILVFRCLECEKAN
jgi:hypothetical protein